MGKILSIIVPTYNMQDYLNRCLQSLIVDSQLLEVLVINDGSKDNSLSIALEYEKAYPNIFRVIDKDNGNYGSCINKGLHEATGKYVKILDADDQFNTQSLELLLKKASTNDVDAFITDYVKAPIEGKQQVVKFNLPQNTPITFTEVCNSKDIVGLWMHAITYKRENLLRINYQQTEGISYTDQEWIFTPLTTVQKLIYIPLALYIYTEGREGQTMSKEFSFNHFEDTITCARHMLAEYTQLHNIPNEVANLLSEKLFRRIRFIYKYYLLKSPSPCPKSLYEFDLQIKKTCSELYIRSNQILLSRPLLPFKYIKYWRKDPNGTALRYMIKTYHTIKSL